MVRCRFVVALSSALISTLAMSLISGIAPVSTAADSNLPGTPYVKVDLIGNGKVTLKIYPSSNDGSLDILRYAYSLNSGITWKSWTYQKTSQSYVVSNLVNDRVSKIWVRAVNSVGAGPANTSTTVTTTARVPRPPACAVKSKGDGFASLAITNADDVLQATVTQYQYRLSFDGKWITLTPSRNLFTISGLINGQFYEVYFRAKNVNGYSQPSNPLTIATYSVPDSPTITSISTIATGFRLQISPPADLGGKPISGYQVTSDGGKTWAATQVVNGDQISVTGLKNATGYLLGVQAVNSIGVGYPTDMIAADLNNDSSNTLHVTRIVKTETPFIRFVKVSIPKTEEIDSVTFSITPRTDSKTKPISATYTSDYLTNNNYLSLADSEITVPVIGLYAKMLNSVKITFKAGLTTTEIVVPIYTPAWVDAYGDPDRYVNITRLVPRNNAVPLSYSLMMIKAEGTASAPIVMDVDGQVRWVGNANLTAANSMFYQNAMYVGYQATLHQVSLDGRTQAIRRYSDNPKFSSFHHNFDPGKDGMLTEVTTSKDIESTIVELGTDGSVIRTFDFAKIIADDMRAYGDNPNLFVRRGLDWFHSNSAFYWPEKNSLIVSSRENFVIAINYTTQKIQWILGDTSKLWYRFGSLRRYALALSSRSTAPMGQHTVSITSSGKLLLFDNGHQGRIQIPAGKGRRGAVVRQYSINTDNMTADESWTFINKTEIASSICSSAYEYQGSYLVDYSAEYDASRPYLFVRLVGLTADKKIAFDYRIKHGWDAGWNAIPIDWSNLVFQ